MSDPTKKHPLFPPFLNHGSRGAAVDELHKILEMLGYGLDIVADLTYGPTTALRVHELQRELGVEADGNFGPATRDALLGNYYIDVDKISWAPQDGITVWIDNEGQPHVWPPAE